MKARIKELRAALGLSMAKFGRKIGVTDAAVSRWENGSRNITDAAILAICREYGVSETWLRTGEGEMFAPRSREAELGDLIGRLIRDRDQTFRAALLTAALKIPPDSPVWDEIEKAFEEVIRTYKKSPEV